jgi:hypothetical protein
MRVIEQEIVKRLQKWKPGPVSLMRSISCRDSFIANGASLSYVLHLSVVAKIRENSIELGVMGARWQTRTTKSRINAIAHAYNLPTLYSKHGEWYWLDGVSYMGIRVFSIGHKPVKAEHGQTILEF